MRKSVHLPRALRFLLFELMSSARSEFSQALRVSIPKEKNGLVHVPYRISITAHKVIIGNGIPDKSSASQVCANECPYCQDERFVRPLLE